MCSKRKYSVILLKNEPQNYDSDFLICGRTSEEWMKQVCGENFGGVVDACEDLKQAITPFLTDCLYTFVINSLCPLITRDTLRDVAEYLSSTGKDAVRLTAGYAFKTSSFDSIEFCGNLPSAFFDEEDFLAVTNAKILSFASSVLKTRINNALLQKGVIMPDPSAVYIDGTAEIETGAVIYPGNYIYGGSRIGKGTTLFPGCIIKDTVIGENCTITSLHSDRAVIGCSATVGPNVNLRPGAVIGDNTRIGNFVEIKNAKIGSGTKVAHLSYIGDAVLGENCNVGCGTVFANYNGKIKQKTVVGDRVFIGCNANLVAPLEIGDDVLIAAGSTVTRDIPSNAMAIARPKQENKENYMKK